MLENEPVWPSQGLYLTLCSWKAILQDSSVVLLECSSEVWFQQCSYLCFNCFVIHQILLAVWDPLAYAQILHNFEHLTTTRSITLLYLYFFNSSIVNLPWIFLTRIFDKGKKVLSVFFRNILYFFFLWINLNSDQVSDENSCTSIQKSTNLFEC